VTGDRVDGRRPALAGRLVTLRPGRAGDPRALREIAAELRDDLAAGQA